MLEYQQKQSRDHNSVGRTMHYSPYKMNSSH